MKKQMLLTLLAAALTVTASLAEAAPRGKRSGRSKKNTVRKRTDRKKPVAANRTKRGADRNNVKARSKVDTPKERRADRNNNNRIEPREAAAMKRHSMDANKDGKIDGKERTKFWTDHKGKVNTPGERKYDANKDGVLSGAEAREFMADRLRLINTNGKAKVNTAIERKFDANKDGIIDRNEAGALRDAIGQRRIVDKHWEKLADFNKDGVIQHAEARKFWTAAKSKVNTRFEKKYDADGNGWLSGKEAREMMIDRLRIINTHGKAIVNTKLEKTFDANGDGVIDKSEAQAIRESLQEVDQPWEQRADKNDDGKVGPKELRKFQSHRKHKPSAKP
jgi:Ca2+-binding EF-hand superfamily protein